MKRPFSLSPRLMAAAELVPAGSRLADIGTDHGRFPVWLIQRGRVEHAIATDLREKPLSRARDLAEKWQVSDRVELRLCNGLSTIRPQEVDVVTITGMGGETIADILAAARWNGGHTYILQPMTGLDGLRRYLSGNGYVICREVLAEEGGTLYLVLLARRGKDAPYSEGEIWVGRQRRDQESPLRARYLDQELGRLRWAASGLEKSQNPEDGDRLAYFRQAARQVEEMKKEWDEWQA